MAVATLLRSGRRTEKPPLQAKGFSGGRFHKSIYNMEQRGEFPKRIALTSRNVAWDLGDVENWIKTKKESGTQATRPGNAPVVKRAA